MSGSSAKTTQICKQTRRQSREAERAPDQGSQGPGFSAQFCHTLSGMWDKSFPFARSPFPHPQTLACIGGFSARGRDCDQAFQAAAGRSLASNPQGSSTVIAPDCWALLPRVATIPHHPAKVAQGSRKSNGKSNNSHSSSSESTYHAPGMMQSTSQVQYQRWGAQGPVQRGLYEAVSLGFIIEAVTKRTPRHRSSLCP